MTNPEVLACAAITIAKYTSETSNGYSFEIKDIIKSMERSLLEFGVSTADVDHSLTWIIGTLAVCISLAKEKRVPTV